MKIAFLFLTIDNINHPDIWKEYLKGHENQYNLYCHAKYPENVTIDWLKHNLIKEHVETGWGRIVGAYLALLTEAYYNKENIKFITVSESCIPLQTFDSLYKFLSKDNVKTSYIKLFDNQDRDINIRIKSLPEHNIIKNYVKHYARFCLSRFHCEQLVKADRKKIDFFSNMDIGDEHFLSILDFNDKYILNCMISYDNWEIIDKNVKILRKQIWTLIDNNGDLEEISKLKAERNKLRNNPHTYHNITDNDVKTAKKTKAFFWRKIAKDSNITNNTVYANTIRKSHEFINHYKLLDRLNHSRTLQKKYENITNTKYNESEAHYRYFTDLFK